MQKLPSLQFSGQLFSAEALFQWIDRLSDRLGLSQPPVVTREQLQACPPQSLGREWIELVTRNGYPLLTSGPRRKQLHDAIHVLTGYDTDDWGELEVQAFLLGCKFRHLHLPIVAGLLRRLGRSGQLTGPWRDRVRAAYRRGQAAADTFDPDNWPAEYLLDMPVVTVRECLGIPAQ
ncbi:hypothetical protein H6G51_12530 [Limnothrix sp. FACHB-708]|uniref:hypothetical protein n=1 Tax=unclassified Limnothrix TaxID=2632864 RepID=UPI001682AA10|nr:MULTISPECIES: hypothetical protein [unclassified Limnothrix]MBD2554109.1 hypothetical protein [Limnothrix sp. FACHB-708]MBD2590991.1 hypothetical protein [Limnothrix sp. FACHB-406]